MKVLPLVTVPDEDWLPKNETDLTGFAAYEINADKLILVLCITFGFILMLLMSLLCIFYFMGFMQNQFGWTWGRPMGAITTPSPYFPESTTAQSRYGHVVPPCYGVAHQC